MTPVPGSSNSGPGGKMPPSTAGETPAGTPEPRFSERSHPGGGPHDGGSRL